MVRQADNPFVSFSAKPNKGLSPRSRRDRKWVRERELELDKGTQRKAVGQGWRELPVDTEAEVTSRHERGSSSSEGRQVKMRQHSSWIVEFSLEIHANVSLHMHIGNAMLHNSSSYTLS